MRHGNFRHKMNVKPSHRKSLLRNLAIEVIDHGSIKTTTAKAKAIRGYVEKLITLAKTDSVHSRRIAFSKLNNKDMVTKLFVEVAPKFKERAGGYTRITKLADKRVGDAAPMSTIGFVE